MDVVLFAAAVVVCTIPFLAAAIVSVASKREDAAWSLGLPAGNPVDAAARRIVDFHTELSRVPATKEQALARDADRRAGRAQPRPAGGEQLSAGVPPVPEDRHPPFSSDQPDYAGAPVGRRS